MDGPPKWRLFALSIIRRGPQCKILRDGAISDALPKFIWVSFRARPKEFSGQHPFLPIFKGYGLIWNNPAIGGSLFWKGRDRV